MTYFKQLDGLRTIAVISVIMSHWVVPEIEDGLIKQLPWNHGVILFFVLSGYLITNILLNVKSEIELQQGLKERGKKIKGAIRSFFARRVLRIFPIYYLLIFLMYYWGDINDQLIWFLSYTTNFLIPVYEEFLGNYTHLWSLAIEEQFYLVWPFVILFINLKKLKNVFLLIILFSFISRGICTALFLNSEISWMWGAYLTPNLFLPLVLGASLALIKMHYPSSGLYSILINPLALYGMMVVYFGCYYFLFIDTQTLLYYPLFDEYLFALMVTFVIARASEDKFKFFGKMLLQNDISVYLGKISYGMYLYHPFIPLIFWRYLGPEYQVSINTKEAFWFFSFCLLIVISTLSYTIIEKPLVGLKKYFKYN